MKGTNFKFWIAAIAAIVMLGSCQEEPIRRPSEIPPQVSATCSMEKQIVVGPGNEVKDAMKITFDDFPELKRLGMDYKWIASANYRTSEPPRIVVESKHDATIKELVLSCNGKDYSLGELKTNVPVELTVADLDLFTQICSLLTANGEAKLEYKIKNGDQIFIQETDLLRIKFGVLFQMKEEIPA